MNPSAPSEIASTHLRLGQDGVIEALPVDDTFWARLIAGDLGDFHHQYLVSGHTFEQDWTMWEMHPHGDEVVCLLSGEATFVLEHSHGREEVVLSRVGMFVVVPRGTWHTAKVARPASLLFITAGEGTRHREISPPVPGRR